MVGVILRQTFEAIAYGGLLLLLACFLKVLVTITRVKNVKPLEKQRQDEFMTKFGYSYDYVFVFKVYVEDEIVKLNKLQEKFTMKEIIDRCRAAKIESKLFYSCQRDEIYAKFRVEMNRLLQEADRIDYKLMLDRKQLRLTANEGGNEWRPINITDEFKVSPYDPYEFIYAKYDQSPDLQTLYRHYPASSNTVNEDHMYPLRPVDRVKLMVSIMEAPFGEPDFGCGFQLNNFSKKKVLLAQYPLHDFDELETIRKQWIRLFASEKSLPITQIKDYFGEQIGLYMAFLQYFVTMIKWPAVIGLIAYAYQVLFDVSAGEVQPFAAVALALWTTFFDQGWKGRQSTLAMEWGVVGFEDEEQDRAEFRGEPSTSPVDGAPQMYYAPRYKVLNYLLIASVSIFFYASVGGQVALIAAIQYALLTSGDGLEINYLGKPGLGYVIGFLLTGLIWILDTLFLQVAFWLNDIQNHRTETEYEDSLVTKVFAFQFFNNFAYLSFIAFAKQYYSLACIDNNCFQEIADILQVQFLLPFVIDTLYEVVYKEFKKMRLIKKETTDLEPGREVGVVEMQYLHTHYSMTRNTLKEYSSVTVLFGYTALFSTVYPVAPLLCLLRIYFKSRLQGWSFCQIYRRPMPSTAEDIGVWQDIMSLLGVIAVAYTFGLIFLDSGYFDDSKRSDQWLYFILTEHLVILLKFVINLAFDDVPEEVDLQLQRQQFLVSKVIFNARDEAEEEFHESRKASAIRISITDSDWIYPDEGQDVDYIDGDGGSNADEDDDYDDEEANQRTKDD